MFTATSSTSMNTFRSVMVETEPTYRNVNTVDIVVIIAISFPFYLYFDWAGEPFRGLVAAMSTACLTGLISVLWPLVRRSRFWWALIFIMSLHVILVYFLPYKGDFRFGFAFLPLFFLDAYLSARFIIYVCGAR